jgi:hypothetical protein
LLIVLYPHDLDGHPDLPICPAPTEDPLANYFEGFNNLSNSKVDVVRPVASQAYAIGPNDFGGQTGTILFSGKVKAGEVWKLNVAEINASLDASDPNKLLLQVGNGLGKYKVSNNTGASVELSPHACGVFRS